MLRYIVFIVFVLCLAVVGVLVYQWATMLQELEEWELARQKATEKGPTRLLFSPKESPPAGDDTTSSEEPPPQPIETPQEQPTGEPQVSDQEKAEVDFLLDVVFSDMENMEVRALALEILAAKDLAQHCTAELSFFFASISPEHPLWGDVADVLARKCGESGRSMLKRLLESTEMEGNHALARDLTMCLSADEGLEKDVVLRDLLDILLRRLINNSERRLVEAVFQGLDAVFSRTGEREFAGVPEKLIDAFALAREVGDRARLLGFLGRCSPSPVALDFLVSQLEGSRVPELRKTAAAVIEERFASVLAQSGGAVTRLLLVYENEVSPEIRGALAAVLVRSQGMSFMPQVRTLYEKEPEASVRQRIAVAIGQLCKPEAFAQVQGMFEKEPERAVRDELLRAMVASDFDRGLAYMDMIASKEGNKELQKIVRELRQRVR